MNSRTRALLLGAALFGQSTASHAGEGFGLFKTVVGMDRVSPPQVILSVKQYTLVFRDDTGRAAQLRQRIESDIRAGDPEMKMTNNAPFVLTVNVRSYLSSNTHAIDGTFQLGDRAGRTIRDGSLSASNAGALVSSSDEELIAEAAGDVVRILVPQRHRSAVLLPKGQMAALIPLAEKGDWRGYLGAVERLPRPAGDAGAYQDYALAVAHEGVAYQSHDLEETVQHLHEAIARNLAAARSKPDERLFSEQYEPLHRAFNTPGTPPKRWVDPHEMELWESMLRIRKWTMAAPSGTLDNRSILEMAAAGRQDEAILAAVSHAERVAFSLDHADMTALSKAGLSWPLIDGMRSKAGLPRREFRITPDNW
jgi:hypothetical protein